MARSYDVHVRAVRTRKRADRASVSYEVRWSVAGQPFSKSFRTKAQADSAAADLRSAAKAGDAFDTTTGQPANTNAGATPTVLTLAREVFAKEWALGAGKTRKSLAEAMAHTVAVLTTPQHPVDEARRVLLYQALYQGGLSPDSLRPPDAGKAASRRTAITSAHHDALRWLERASLPVGRVDRKTAEATLARFATNLDATPAAANVRTRRRAGFSKILEHAAAEGHIPASPLRTIKVRKAQQATERVSRSVVGDPSLIPAALAHIRGMGKRGALFAAFLAVVFYSGARPGEVAALCLEHCHLPTSGWGVLTLSKSAAAAGTAWTDSGEVRDDRGLKLRAEGDERRVPIPPVLVGVLREFVATAGIRSGRLFTTATGAMLSESEVGEFWHGGRAAAMPDAAPEALVRVYDLRHAAASLWLRTVPVGVVAARLGHSPEMCLRVYHHLIEGDEARWNEAIEDAMPV